ncbi:MAG: hypothetical protein ACOZF0_08800 [Thermodesulfobacteriota bacterium]
MKIIVTIAAYLLSLAVIAAAAFFVVLILAGPHSGLLPSWLEPVVLGIGWLVVLVLPIWIALKVWRRFRPSG